VVSLGPRLERAARPKGGPEPLVKKCFLRGRKAEGTRKDKSEGGGGGEGVHQREPFRHVAERDEG